MLSLPRFSLCPHHRLIPCVCPSDNIARSAAPRFWGSAACARGSLRSARVIHDLTTPWFRGSHLPVRHPLRTIHTCSVSVIPTHLLTTAYHIQCPYPESHSRTCPQPGSHGVAMSWITPADRRAAREPGDRRPQKRDEPRSARCCPDRIVCHITYHTSRHTSTLLFNNH